MTKIFRFEVPQTNKEGTKKFIYKYKDGTVVKDATLLQYIDGLRIPPNYKDVVIFYTAKPKQTACGVDDRGRTQCLYSEDWRKKSSKKKFCDLIRFGELLPQIQQDCKAHLRSTRMTKNKIISLVLRIVSFCYFRLGTLKYESQNSSYGITTIRKEHVKFERDTAVIQFVGKKGVHNHCVTVDPEAVAVLRELHAERKADDHLMMYKHGNRHEHILHTDINHFLKEYDPGFTSKMFRTWNSNIMVIHHLRNNGGEDPTRLTVAKRKKKIVETMRHVSAMVHNTPAICRKDYVSKELVDMYIDHPRRFRAQFMTPDLSERALFLRFLKSQCDSSQ